MPGVGAAQVVVLDPQLHAHLSALPVPAQNSWSSLGIVALRAAWTDGDAWLAALLERLDAQRTLLGKLLAEHLPEARMRPLEATYLPWVDLRAYDVADPAAAAERHGVLLGAGDHYHPGLPGHVRINIATDAGRLTEVVRRTAAALIEEPA
jgi:cystathionine beta-lyase